VDHVRCAGKGEGTCEWRAEWRSISHWRLRVDQWQIRRVVAAEPPL